MDEITKEHTEVKSCARASCVRRVCKAVCTTIEEDDKQQHNLNESDSKIAPWNRVLILKLMSTIWRYSK